ncbi:RidA family protein [Ewingella sp. S1.OA.A_B6]
MTPEEKISSLNLILPPAPTPAGSYVPARVLGNLLYLSGQGPRHNDGTFMTGRLGSDIAMDEGYQAARNAALQLLAAARDAVGDLSRIESVVRVFGMTNATPEFSDHAGVINGCSDLLAEVFGEAGYHTRSVAGMSSLPFGMIVQVEAVFSLKISAL